MSTKLNTPAPVNAYHEAIADLGPEARVVFTAGYASETRRPWSVIITRSEHGEFAKVRGAEAIRPQYAVYIEAPHDSIYDSQVAYASTPELAARIARLMVEGCSF